MWDAPLPHVAHARLAAKHATTFILESRDGPQRIARYSMVGWNPAGTVTLDRHGLRIAGNLPAPSRDQEPMTYLRRILDFYRTDEHAVPFVGGLVGVVGYDFARTIEPTLARGERSAERAGAGTDTDDAWPHFTFGLYLDAIVYDHAEKTTHYVSRGPDRRGDLAALRAPSPASPTPPASSPQSALKVGAVTTTGAAPFIERVKQAQDLIRAGECFQIVLSRSYHARFEGDLGPCYDWLRENAQVPYLYFLRFAGAPARALLGASPETLVRIRRGLVETFPIAGTRPVTGDARKDKRAADELRRDRKENAEHAMLVDLARNDVGRVAAPGSVRVVRERDVERFRHVQHLVSQVEGRLDAGRDALDALAAVFPAGTVTGAPKVRAMQHIDALEDRPRGPYAGAVCYASFNGDFDSAITIRSLSAQDDRLTVQAGAGIVIASDPEREFRETQQKAATLLEALAAFGATLPRKTVEVAP